MKECGVHKKRFVVFITAGVLLLLAAACSPGGTPAPAPEMSQATYTHPSGVYSLALPGSWTVGDLSDAAALVTMFAPPGADQPSLTAVVIRLNSALDETAFEAVRGSFLRAPYNASLDVLDQAPMADRSWRAAGVRHAGGRAIPVNVFMQADGPYFSALEVAVPAGDALTLALLSRIVNSYRVQPEADRPAGTVDALPPLDPDLMLAAGNLSFEDLFTGAEPDGRFYISGQVANRASYPVEIVALRAALYDSAGNLVQEQTASVPLPVLLDGEYAPFMVRFDGARPARVARYRLQAEAQEAGAAELTRAGTGSFDWEDRAEYDETGLLHIRGTIWNAGPAPVREAQAVATLFDAANRAIGYVSQAVVSDALAPGESIRFDLSVPALAAEPVRYQLVVFVP